MSSVIGAIALFRGVLCCDKSCVECHKCHGIECHASRCPSHTNRFLSECNKRKKKKKEKKMKERRERQRVINREVKERERA